MINYEIVCYKVLKLKKGKLKRISEVIVYQLKLVEPLNIAKKWESKKMLNFPKTRRSKNIYLNLFDVSNHSKDH